MQITVITQVSAAKGGLITAAAPIRVHTVLRGITMCCPKISATFFGEKKEASVHFLMHCKLDVYKKIACKKGQNKKKKTCKP